MADHLGQCYAFVERTRRLHLRDARFIRVDRAVDGIAVQNRVHIGGIVLRNAPAAVGILTVDPRNDHAVVIDKVQKRDRNADRIRRGRTEIRGIERRMVAQHL